MLREKGEKRLMLKTIQATLLLEDGTEYTGRSFGAQGTAVGEVVFTTSAVGCQELLTDPACLGQMIVQTFPLAGNYGCNSEDSESGAACASGCIVREWCEEPSNFRSEGTLDAFLREQNVAGICDIDTRALTIHLREHGTMNGMITTEPVADKPAALAMLKAHRLTVPAAAWQESGEQPRCTADDVVLLDFGCKRSLSDALAQAVGKVLTVPGNTPIDGILAQNPRGIVLAGGPGNPADYAELAQGLAPLLTAGIPVFGVGLGHQLLALAAGGKTAKLAHGHRGSNQAVRDDILGKTFVTSQNHGYAVEEASLDPALCTVFCRNSNDKTCEGIQYKSAPIFSIQFDPAAFTGAGDNNHYINRFVTTMNIRGKR